MFTPCGRERGKEKPYVWDVRDKEEKGGWKGSGTGMPGGDHALLYLGVELQSMTSHIRKGCTVRIRNDGYVKLN